MFRSKPLEERLAAAVRSELAGSAADLEGRLRGYRRRLHQEKEAGAALEDAQAQKRRLHSEMLALKKRFWEEHYGDGQDALEEVGRELRSLENAVEEEAGRRLDALEGTLVELIGGLRGDLKEAGRALREECQGVQQERQGVRGEAVGSPPRPAGEPQTTPAGPPRGVRSVSRAGGLLGKARRREAGGGNLPVGGFLALVGLLCLWVGLVEIRGAVALALGLVGAGLANVATAVVYVLPAGR